MKTGRPKKEIDKKSFVDLVGLGCTQEEICWYFRDDTGKPISEDTITRWCKREFVVTFADYKKQNGGMALKIKLRQDQLRIAERSAAMAIFLGKNYLGQSDNPNVEDGEAIAVLTAILAEIKNKANGGDK